MNRLLRISVRIGMWLIISIISSFLLLIIAIQYPKIQQKIINYATSYVSNKTNTRFEIEKISIGFPKNIVLEKVYAEDKQHDTLVYVKELSIGLEMLKLLKGEIVVNILKLDGVKANLYRTQSDSNFNYNFLIDVFASAKSNNPNVKQKDTTVSAIQLQINTVALSDIRFAYKDALNGINTKAEIGRLDLNMQHIDLAKLEFKANELAIAESDIEVTIEKANVEEKDTTTSVLPSFGIEKLMLNNVHFVFNSKPDSFALNTQIGLLELKPELIDLNKQHITINQFKLHQSNISIATISKPLTTDIVEKAPETLGWKIAVHTIDIKENKFKYDVNNITKQKQGIDYNHLAVAGLGLQAKNVLYTTDVIKGDINHLKLTEQCGLELRKLKTQFIYDDKHIELANLLIQTPHSVIANYAAIQYSSIQSLTKNIEQLRINLNVKQTRVAMQDVLLFAPDLKKEDMINLNKMQVVQLDAKINGQLNNLTFEKCIIRTGKQTALAFNGSIKGLPNAKKIKYDITLQSLISSHKDIVALLPKTILPSSIQIPHQIKISGRTYGGINDNHADVKFESTAGFAHIVSSINQLDAIPNYTVAIITQKFDVGYIVKQPMIGTISGKINAKGTHFDLKKITTDVTVQLDEIEVNKYTYANTYITIKADAGMYASTVSAKDKALDFDLIANASLSNEQTKANIDFLLTKADLKALRITNESITTSGHLMVNLTQKDSNNLRGKVSIGDVVVAKKDKRYVLDSLVAVSLNANRNNTLYVNHSIVKIEYNGETGLTELSSVIKQYVSQFVGKKSTEADSLSQSFNCSVQIHPHPFLSEVILPKLTQFDGLTLNANYSSKQQVLHFKVDAPIIQYDNKTINNLAIIIDGDNKNINYNASVSSFSAGVIAIPKTKLVGNVQQQIINYKLQIEQPDSGYKLMLAGQVNSATKNRTSIKFTNDAQFNNTEWLVNKQNEIIITPDGVNIQHLELKHNTEFIKINSISLASDAPIYIQFNQFELGTLSRIIEKDTAIVRGLLQGDFNIQSIKQFAFTSDLTVSNLSFKSFEIGDLSIKANNLTTNKYEAHLALVSNENNATIDGFFQNNNIDFKVNIIQVKTQTIETFIPNIIKRSDGSISGKFTIQGSVLKPDFNGEIDFKKTSFNLVFLNTKLMLDNEKIRFDNSGFYFSNFTVLDSMQQPLKINGAVYTTNFTSLNFDLNITSKNFRVLNTNSKNNAVYYGKILLNSTIKIEGTETLPIISANVELIEGSEFTFVVQQGELSTDKGEGVVLFTDSTKSPFSPPDSIANMSTFKGLDFTANIEVNKFTSLKVITDKKSGDYLTLSGDALLRFAISPSGKMSLIGTYTVNEGKYKASFQQIVKRDFVIKKGGTIQWEGSPLDANIDITASYRAKTGATDLLAAELAGKSESERNAYRKLLDYDVNLIMKGVLLKPKLNFNLDMPVKDQQVFNGMVYAKINQINNDENELNKQVFSILILGRFIPVGISSNVSTTDAVTTIARNSVNQILSEQLNAISGKYIKGAELNFNLQTNEDFTSQSSTQNTELQIGLKKELFNQRVSLQVGSNIDVDGKNNQGTGQNITGDMIMEYKITEDGSYRFKAFRENNYEGIIDGMLYKTGIGFLYTRDYDSLNQLFVVPKKEIKTEEGKID